jgi:hypothetical protein
MTTIQAQMVGDNALLARSDFERLVELARRSEMIEVQVDGEELTAQDIMRLANQGGSFEFWNDRGEDIYSTEDGEPIQ